MEYANKRITSKGIFLVALFVLLASRILVLTDNYVWTLNPVLIEEVYLVAAVGLALTAHGGKFRVSRGGYWYVLAVLLLHTVLWGLVFVDRRFDELIHSLFKSQIVFVAIIWVTVLTVYQLDAGMAFLKCCYYTLSALLMYYFLTNLSDLDLSNLANIMTISQRTRANFGFGHYNTLGAACVCNILLREVVRKDRRSVFFMAVDLIVLIMSVCMLLCSASRSAITSLILYFVVYYSWKIDDWNVSKKIRTAIKILRNVFVGVMILWVLLEVDFSMLLVEAQRSVIFTHAIPMFFEVGNIWLGLGYADNVAYATNQTPYITYWLDNAYVYYLIATGIIGCALLMSALFVLGRELYRKSGLRFGKEAFSAFLVYAYASLFEVMLFNSGVIASYIYLPWFLIHISQKGNVENRDG